jgi:hypothetical protein
MQTAKAIVARRAREGEFAVLDIGKRGVKKA